MNILKISLMRSFRFLQNLDVIWVIDKIEKRNKKIEEQGQLLKNILQNLLN